MLDVTQVRTARLTGCRPELRDADDLHRIMADPRVAAWLFPGSEPPSVARIRSMLVRDLDHWKRHRFGPWLVRDAASNRLVGRIGLRREPVEDVPETEVLWLVDADRWGEGLASEMAAEAVRTGLGVLGLESVVAFTLPGNTASRRVMEKCGLAYERDFVRAGLPHVLYRVTRSP